MWMFYSAENWPIAVDLKSSINRLKRKLGDLMFDAAHEAVYGMEKFLSVEECKKLEDKYERGYNLCNDYLDKRLEIKEFCNKLVEADLKEFLYDIKSFLPAEIIIIHQLNEKATDSETEQSYVLFCLSFSFYTCSILINICIISCCSYDTVE